MTIGPELFRPQASGLRAELGRRDKPNAAQQLSLVSNFAVAEGSVLPNQGPLLSILIFVVLKSPNNALVKLLATGGGRHADRHV